MSSYRFTGANIIEEEYGTKAIVTRRENINTCYVLLHSCIIGISMIQYGIGIASWSNLLTTFAAILEWSDHQQNVWNIGITTITNLGAMIGALVSGQFVRYGKLRMLLILNGILLTSIAACMIENIYVIATARFFWGIVAGSVTVFVPKYLNEFVPLELRGAFGGIPALGITTGIAIPAVLSIALPVDPVAAYKENPNNFFVTEYWRVIWLVPAFLALVQSVLLLTCFRFETPIDMK